MDKNDPQVVICRTCIEECTEYKSLHQQGLICGEVTTLATLLTYCTEMILEEDMEDHMPKHLCIKCIQDLARCYVFKKKALESNNFLQSQLMEENVQLFQDKVNNIEIKEAQFNEDDASQTCEELISNLHKTSPYKKDLDKHNNAIIKPCAPLTIVSDHIDGGDYEVQLELTLPNDYVHDEEEDANIEYIAETSCSGEIYITNEQEDVHPEKLSSAKSNEDEDDIAEEYEIHINNTIEETEYVELITPEVQNEMKTNCQPNQVDDDDDDDDEEYLHSQPSGHMLLKKYKHKKRIRNDMKKAKPEYKCQICSKQLSNANSFRYHMQLHSDKTPYVCSLCGERFKTPNAYDGHLSIHNPNNPNTCELCGKSYRQSSSLRVHMLSHAGVKPFTCDICGKKLTQKSGYKKHLLTHTGEKPHSCDVCGKMFRYSSNMLAHRRVHTGEKPFKCSKCDRCFITSEQARRHQMVHSGEKPYSCEVCDKTFKRPATLRTHQQVHQEHEKAYESAITKIAKSNVVQIC